MKRYPIKQYARALIELSQEGQSLDAVYKDMKTIQELIRSSQDFSQFLRNPVIVSDKRRAIVEEIFKNRLHETTYRFLLFLDEKNRLALLEEICQLFEEMYQEINNIAKAKIFSRFDLAPADVKHISSILKEKIHKDIDPEVILDKSLLGGIRIKIKDFVYDLSLQNQLQKFHKNLFNT